jgi:hypothetical protein
VVALALAGLTGLTYRANSEVADCFSAPRGSPRFCAPAAMYSSADHVQRLNLEAALDAGLMDAVADGATVQLANVYSLWHDTQFGLFFYAKHTRKRFSIVGPTAAIPPARGSSAYRLRDVASDARTGFVILSRLGTGPGPAARLFVRHPALARAGVVPALLDDAGPPASARPAIVPLGPGATLIRSGPDWRLFELSAPATGGQHQPAPDTLRVVVVPADRVRL